MAANLNIVRGRHLGAAGQRINRFRITNTAKSSCRLYGFPSFHFRNRAGNLIGHVSVPAGVKAKVVVLKPGATTRVAVGTVEPANVTVPGACRPRTAQSVDIKLAFRPHVYKVPITVRVCTTKRYRPMSYPVGS